MDDASFDELWADVTPVPQVDGPNPVVKIAYSADFTKLMDLFRGIVAIGEHSQRVLELTEELLELNAANYTIWQYRRECLKALNSDLNEELDYLDGFSKENPKNYQIWHHRRTVVEWLGSGERELAFCESVFEVDAKNYHAWAHRQWALQSFNLWERELAYIEECLVKDIRNNSAWNQRWFYVHSGPEMLTNEVLQREVDYCMAALRKVTLNESAWNYLRGLHKYHKDELLQTVKAKCEEIAHSSEQTNIYALGLLADICEEEGTALLAPTVLSTEDSLPTPPPSTTASGSSTDITGTVLADVQSGLRELQRACEICTALVVLDQIRAKSWTRRVQALKSKIGSYSIRGD